MTSNWTPERRLKQAARIKKNAIWQTASGPQTPQGKARSAQNANQGLNWPEIRQLRTLLKIQRRQLNELQAKKPVTSAPQAR
jgi:hypothetical protein